MQTAVSGASKTAVCIQTAGFAFCLTEAAHMASERYRTERDTMGEVRVPAEALYRAQTQRAVENFPISGRGLEPAHVAALARIKAAAAHVNASLGVIPGATAEAIEAAAADIVNGGYLDQFPVDVFQT